MYYFYLFLCKDGSLYAGIAADVEARAAQHNRGVGSKYVRSRGGGEVVYSEQFPNRSEAQKREAAVKRLSKSKKLELIQQKKLPR